MIWDVWDGFTSSVGDRLLGFCLRFAGSIFILAIGLWVIRIISGRLSKGKAITKLDESAKSFLNSFIKISLYLVLALIIAATMGVATASLITLLGSAGIAVGLALQGGLSNLAGGIMILIFKPFKAGDVITFRDHTGKVMEIDIYYTSIRAWNNDYIKIPNGTAANEIVKNHTAFDLRRTDLTFNVPRDSNIEKVRMILMNTAMSHRCYVDDPPVAAVVTGYADSAIQFSLRAWCKAEDYGTFYFDMLENVKKNFDDNDIKIPYQNIDMHIINDIEKKIFRKGKEK